MDRNKSVCIIGAGAAGLTAGHMLRKQGYQRVTVLEKGDRVGGKCCTISHGGLTYELGAGIHTNAYRTVSEIMRDVALESQPVRGHICVDFEKGRWLRFPRYVNPRKVVPTLAALARLWAEMRRQRRIFDPGLSGLDPEVWRPFAEWVGKRGLGPVAELMSVVHTGYGYGYYEEVAAAYALKYITIMKSARELLDGGFQGLWERVAEPLDVRTGVTVRSIVRDQAVRVETETETLEFDTLILAAPLDRALTYLDASETERDLFSRIRYYDYHVFAAFTRGLPRPRYAFVPGHQSRAAPGRTMFWYRRWAGSNLLTFYALGRSSLGGRECMDHEEVRHNIETDLQRVGGQIEGYLTDRVWTYFPHVTPSELQEGYYERLEALQGQNRTYYAGELLNFSTVETVARYSKHLVDRHFA